jgi:hypothetical protein
MTSKLSWTGSKKGVLSEALLVEARMGDGGEGKLAMRLQQSVSRVPKRSGLSNWVGKKVVVRRWMVQNKIRTRGLLSFGKERQDNETGSGGQGGRAKEHTQGRNVTTLG